MRKPRAPSRRQRSTMVTVPAPTGGLNGRDNLAAMPPGDAFVLDNIFPGTATCEGRGGSLDYLTGAGAPVESLELYAGGAQQRLLAFAGGKVWNASVSGVAAAPLQTGRVGNQIVSTMFSNAGNQFLIGVSGLDVPFSYNGVVVTNLVMTGIAQPEALAHVFAYKGRLYFAEKQKLGFWYLPVGQIQGALAYFDLSQVARSGGYLVAMASFSQDSGNGPNDYAVFITSEGEYIVYAGYDPTNAATWELVSRYYAAAPLGRKCTVNYKTDLIILTEDGALPFSEIRREGRASDEDSALTSKLGRLLSAYNANANVHGWQAITYSRGGMLVLNTPTTSSIAGKYVQFVMNSKTGAWCRFTGWDGLSWAVYDKRLYFGTYDGRVVLADEGRLDNGADIRFDVKTAYNYLEDGRGSGQLNKLFHFAKLIVSSDGKPPLSAQLNVDYVEDQPEYVSNPPAEELAVWDVATWDVSGWGVEETTQVFVASLGRYGTASSLWLRGSLKGTTFKWYAVTYIYERAKGLF